MFPLKKPMFFLIGCLCTLLSSCGENSNSEESTTDINESETASSVVSKNNMYANPIFPLVDGEPEQTYMADPFAIRADDGLYYLYTTQTEVIDPSVSSIAKIMKRGPIFVSPDLVNWVYAGDVFSNYEPSWGTKGAGVWAPTVCKVGHYYNYYYSLSTGGDKNPGIGVARSLSPTGPFEHYGKLFNSNEIGVTNSIDPYVFYDNGNLYMAFGSYGGLITIVELTEDGLGLKNGLEYQKENKVAIAGYEKYEMKNYEGTIIYKKDDKYYLFLSTGTCCSGAQSTYHVVVAVADNLFGPYKDSKGKDMFGPERGDYVVVPSMSGAMGVGHMTLVEDDLGDVWMLYHGYDTTSSTANDRVLYLDKIIFDKETGLPHVEGNKASNGEEKPGPYFNDLED